jgi:predicted DNA-binding transcriptional regulator AlpA
VATNDNTQEVEILTSAAAAEYVSLSVSMLAKMRCLGGGPAYIKLGRAVRYARVDLDFWLAARRVRNTSDADRLPASLITVTTDI